MKRVATTPATEPRWLDLRFILRGSKRGLVGLSVLSLVVAVSETVVLAAVVQSASALSAKASSISANIAGWHVQASITNVLAVAVIAAVVRGVLGGIVAIRGPRIAAASRERHRRAVFESYLSASWATQSADQAGRLLQTLSGSVNDANSVLIIATLALPALVTLVVLLVTALVLNPEITASLIAFGFIVGAGLRPLASRANKAARVDALGRNAIASHVAGIVSAGAEITVFGARDGAVAQARTHIARSEVAFARTDGLKRLVGVSVQSIVFLIAALGLLVLSISSLEVDFVIVGTIIVLLLRGAGLAQQVQGAVAQYGSASPFIAQVRTQIEHYERNRQDFGSQAFPSDFTLRLDGVAYTYPGSSTPAITINDIRVAAGSYVAILGRSGSGKSTLAQLLLRLRLPESGSVKVGPVDIDAIDEKEFSTHVAYVPQSPHLIPGTISDNITFFRPGISHDAVVVAAKAVHLHDEIRRMPRGYETVIDSHIDQISGGQKQRLALARALLSEPRLLILDEPTSALDTANESAVLDALRGLAGRTTVIMITHKVSSAANCDQVVLVDAGLVRAQGPPGAVLSELATQRTPATPETGGRA